MPIPEKQIEISPKASVQIEEAREAGRELDVAVPHAQAHVVSMALARVVLAVVLAIASFGKVIFFGVSFVVGLTTFVWYLWQASKWMETDAEGNEASCLNATAIARGLFLTLFSGFLAWCLWRVVSFVAPPAGVTSEALLEHKDAILTFIGAGIAAVSAMGALCVALAGKRNRLKIVLFGIGLVLALALLFGIFRTGSADTIAATLRYTRGIAALASLLFLVYAVALFPHLELAFGQELAYRSPLFEQYFFEKLFDWLFGWLYRGKPVPEGYKPPTVVEEVRVEFSEHDDGHATKTMRRGVLLSGPHAMEKARRVARIIIGGGAFSEPSLVTDGPLSRPELEEMREGLENSRYGHWRDPDNHNLGFEITPRGMAIFRVLAGGNGRTAPPHP